MSKILTEEEILAATVASSKQVKQETAAIPKADELDILFPTSVTFPVNGEDITVREFKFGELPFVVKMLKTVGPMFIEAHSSGKHTDPLVLMAIIDQGGEDIMALLAKNVGKPRTWCDSINPEDGFAMLTTMLLINFNFFMIRVVGGIEKILKQATK